MYVCGMTVYDYCHLGHGRVLVIFDVVRRWLRASGLRVTYVRNITDIDDKIIKRAGENREPVEALTERFIRAMEEDAAALGVETPDHEPRATQYVAEMQALIADLLKKSLAYQAASGDVNYAVRRFPGYGKLSGKSLDELRAGERVEVPEHDDRRQPAAVRTPMPRRPAAAAPAPQLRARITAPPTGGAAARPAAPAPA